MKRRLFTLAAGVSLLLCIATVGLWVRSYFVADIFERRDRFDGPTRFGSGVGYLFCSAEYGWGFGPITGWSFARKHPAYAADAMRVEIVWSRTGSWGIHHVLGSIYRSNRPSRRFSAVSYAYPTLATAMLPVAWLALTLGRSAALQRTATGHCVKCGYDLRATPDRCPECGTVPAEKG